MDLPSAIFSRLRNWGPLDAWIGASSTDARRVYHRLAAPRASAPLVVFWIVSDVPYLDLRPGDSGFRRAVVQVATYGTSTVSVGQVAAEVRKCVLALMRPAIWWSADGSSALSIRDVREESTVDDDEDPQDGSSVRDQRQISTFTVHYVPG